MPNTNLGELGAAAFWGRLADGDRVAVTFVLPTGRAAESPSPHLALSTDGLLVAEMTMAMDGLARQAGLAGLVVESLLDIDVAERLRTDGELTQNLILLGSADVNVVVKLLLDRTDSFDAWHAGFTKPYDLPAIRGSRGKLHMFTTSPRTGLLALYDNPWSENRRVVILAAGLFAVGSIAANRLLLEYLTGQRTGNNEFSPDLPMRLVDGVVARYPHLELKSLDDCIPPMDVVNISGIDVIE